MARLAEKIVARRDLAFYVSNANEYRKFAETARSKFINIIGIPKAYPIIFFYDGLFFRFRNGERAEKIIKTSKIFGRDIKIIYLVNRKEKKL